MTHCSSQQHQRAFISSRVSRANDRLFILSEPFNVDANHPLRRRSMIKNTYSTMSNRCGCCCSSSCTLPVLLLLPLPPPLSHKTRCRQQAASKQWRIDSWIGNEQWQGVVVIVCCCALLILCLSMTRTFSSSSSLLTCNIVRVKLIPIAHHLRNSTWIATLQRHHLLIKISWPFR